MTEHTAVAVAPVCLRLLGGWQLIVDGAEVELGHREQRLVALLGLTDLTVRAQVASVLWADSTDEHALGSLRRAVRQCRTRCAGVLVADRLTVALDPGVRVDVDDLRRAAGLSRLPMSDAVAHELHDALRGPQLLPGWFDDWVVDERVLLEQLRVEALERISRAGLERGDFSLAVDAAGVVSAIEPLRELPRELSIRGHLGRGDVASALHELQRYGAVMGEELGLAPPDRIRALVEPLLDDPRRASPQAVVTPARMPDAEEPAAERAPELRVPRPRLPQDLVPEPPPPLAPAMGLDEWLDGGPTRGVRRVRAVLVGAAGVALAVALAFVLGGPGPRPRATTDPGEGVGLVTPEADPGEPGSAQQQPRRTVRVRLVEAGAGTAAFAVRATPLPAEVRLVVRGRAGLRVVRHLVVRDPGGRDVVIQGLGPGSYTWSATSESASAVSGALSLAPPEVEQVSSPETSASETDEVTPVAATASQEPTSTAPPTTPTPAPTPTPTSSPTPHPSPSPPHGSTATPTDPGTLAPDPVG